MDESVTWRDVAWRGDLLARIYEPPAAARSARDGAVVDVHGGAWSIGDRTQGERYGRAAAAAGFVVVAVDFRDGRSHRHPAAVDDVGAAVRWVRDQAGALGIDPARVALTGSSSGGHLALHAALTEVEVAWVGAFWPPVDPLGRYRYAQGAVGLPVPDGQEFHAKRLVRSTEAYFGDEATMAEASIASIVRTGRARTLPPVWVVRAGADLNVPAELLDDLVDAYRGAGGTIELTDYPGQVHGFGHGTHDAARTFQADLVRRLGIALA